MKRLLTLLMVTLGLALGGCGGTDSAVDSGPSALQTTDTVVGTGAVAAAGKIVTVNYTGYLYNTAAPNNRGAIFDSSIGRAPFSFQLGKGLVIAGWDQGVAGMKVGGQRTLVIPSSLGYGSQSVGGIPANSGLIFDVTLLAVQ